jgi:hypothetical protein
LDVGVLFASKLPHYNYMEMHTYLTRIDQDFVKAHGTRKAFHKGGNSSCRTHIRQHYDIYKKKCEKANIPINHWAIPRDIWKTMEEEKEAEEQGRLTKKQQQQQLIFKTVTGPHEFTRAGTLYAVTKLIATNNEVSH